jgi:hypothetical protein
VAVCAAPAPVNAEAKERELRKFRTLTCRGFAGRPMFEGWTLAPFAVVWSMADGVLTRTPRRSR